MKALVKIFRTHKALKPVISRVSPATVRASVAMGVSHCSA